MKNTIQLMFILMFVILSSFVFASCDHKNGGTKEEATTYVVEYYNYNGKYITLVVVEEKGEAIYTGTTPVRPADDEFSYQFIGWDQDAKSVEENMKLTAVFKPIPKEDWSEIVW